MYIPPPLPSISTVSSSQQPKKMHKPKATNADIVDSGTTLSLKPSRWKRFFRKRRRSASVSSATSEKSDLANDAESMATGCAGISNTPSLEDIRIVSCVEEIVLRDGTPESEISSSSSMTLGRKNSEDMGTFQEMGGDGIRGGGGMARDIFSGKTIFVDALEHGEGELYNEQRERDVREGDEGEDGEDRGVQRYDTMKSVYVDALEHETIEVKQTMEIAVVAEIHEGRIPSPKSCSSPAGSLFQITVKKYL
jgi:hypothetical protein